MLDALGIARLTCFVLFVVPLAGTWSPLVLLLRLFGVEFFIVFKLFAIEDGGTVPGVESLLVNVESSIELFLLFEIVTFDAAASAVDDGCDGGTILAIIVFSNFRFTGGALLLLDDEETEEDDEEELVDGDGSDELFDATDDEKDINEIISSSCC